MVHHRTGEEDSCRSPNRPLTVGEGRSSWDAVGTKDLRISRSPSRTQVPVRAYAALKAGGLAGGSLRRGAFSIGAGLAVPTELEPEAGVVRDRHGVAPLG